MAKTVRLGSGSAYWGDLLEPAVKLAELGELDYLSFDHLAELTLAILQRQRAKDPTRGYIADIVAWTEAILPVAKPRGTKIITNAGGANPRAGAERVLEIARRHGLDDTRVGVVSGDDVLEAMLRLAGEGLQFPNLDTGEEHITRIADQIIAANAYIGSEGIITCLEQAADVVVAGRVSDNALYAAPLMHEFGWGFDQPELVGAAVTIGHMVECAALLTGSLSNFWAEAGDTWDIGFPIAEVDERGDAVYSKIDGTGGLLNEFTVKEQLLYEVHDPANYIMPDGIADFTAPTVTQVGPDRVKMTGMTGKARPDTLKVCVGYSDGWIGDGIAMFSWPDALAKARKGEEIVRERLKLTDVTPRAINFEYLGVNTLHGPTAPEPECEPNEVGLRVAAHCTTSAEAHAVRQEILHLWTLGGVGSAIAPPGRPRPVISLWPTLIPRDAVEVSAEVLEA
ncbi:MAG: DUF1446 domain-containing protein [Euzebyaceae bacterium]|nr:DUF1446 domain-containing protein [Euzebyaceae bacterium]